MDGGGGVRRVLRPRPAPPCEKCKREAGGMLIEHATCLSRWTGKWQGCGRRRGPTYYKGVSKLKPRPLSFLPWFFCQMLHRAAADHPELASICHDEGPGIHPGLACPQHPALPALPPSSPITLRLSLCTAKLPISTCMITAHSDLYSEESGGTGFGRRKAAAPASFMPHYTSGMKSEWSRCFSALKLLAVEF